MSLKRSSILVSVGSLFVYLISFLNQVLIAKTFGAGVRMDAFLAGINLPGAITNIAGATFTFAIVPFLVKEGLDGEKSEKKIGGLFAGFACAGVATILIGAIVHVAPLVFGSQFGKYQSEASLSALLSWIAGGIFFVTALSDALFNARKRFLVSVFGYLPAYGLAAIACLLLGPKIGGPAIAIGTLIGYLCFFPYRFNSQKVYLRSGVDFSLFKSIVKRVPLIIIALLMLFGFPVIDSVIAPKVDEGILSILGYSTRLLSTLAVVIGMGPFGVMIPELSKLSGDGDRSAFASRWMALCRYSFVVILPVVIWLTCFRLEIVQVLFQRGSFGLAESQKLSNLLALTIPGALFMIIGMLAVRIMFADSRLKLACLLSVGGLILYSVLAYVLSYRYGLEGFGWSYAVSWFIYTVLALGSLYRKDASVVCMTSQLTSVVKTCAVAIVFGIASVTILRMSLSLPLSMKFLLIGIGFPLVFAGYLALGSRFGIHEMARLWGSVTSKFLRSRSA